MGILNMGACDLSREAARFAEQAVAGNRREAAGSALYVGVLDGGYDHAERLDRIVKRYGISENAQTVADARRAADIRIADIAAREASARDGVVARAAEIGIRLNRLQISRSAD